MTDGLGGPAAGRARRGRWVVLLTAVVAFFAHLPMVLAPFPLAGTEGHRVVPALRMADAMREPKSSEHAVIIEWLVPHLFDQPYLRKPPLAYWGVAASDLALAPLGVGEWRWRLPSLIAAVGTAAVVACYATLAFDSEGGLVAGLAVPATVAWWSQSRLADVDAVNTAFTALATLATLHLASGGRARHGLWVALGTSGLLLTKGPAGLPLVLGAIVAGGWRRPAAWVGLLAAFAAFASYAMAASAAASAAGIAVDATGVEEGLSNLLLDRQKELLRAPLLLPTLLAVGLPTSGLLLAGMVGRLWRRDDQVKVETVRRERALRGIAITLLVAGGVFLVTGTYNIRYGYVLVPILAAGCAGITLAPDGLQRWALRVSAGLLAVAAVFAASVSFREGVTKALLVLCLSSLLATIVCRAAKCLAASPGARAFAAMIVLAGGCSALPFAHQRAERSARAAAIAAQRVVGDLPVLTGRLGRSKPELFYYGSIETRLHETNDFDLDEIPPGQWLLVDLKDMKKFHKAGWIAEADVGTYVPRAERTRHVTSMDLLGEPIYLVNFDGQNFDGHSVSD